jgi:hypothetical protein
VGEAFSRKSVLGAIAFLLIGGSGVLVVSQSAFAEASSKWIASFLPQLDVNIDFTPKGEFNSLIRARGEIEAYEAGLPIPIDGLSEITQPIKAFGR